jgi:hypothetical protein
MMVRSMAWTVASGATGAAILLTAGCTQQPAPPPVSPPHGPAFSLHAAAKPPDWFHQQLAAARAAKRAHEPKSDTAGAQRDYDTVLLNACTRAASAGPGKYPARCDAVLHPTPSRSVIDPCDQNADDPAVVAECND